MKPNRAIFKTQKMFMPVLTPDTIQAFEFPMNIFMLNMPGSEDAVIPPFILSSATYQSFDQSNGSVSRRLLSQGLEEVGLYRHSKISEQSFYKKNRVLQSSITDPNSTATVDSINNFLFINDRTFFPIPYIPYFSNCTYYGSQLFLYPIIENHPSCKLVREENVRPISNMEFGMQPEADTCKNIALQCR